MKEKQEQVGMRGFIKIDHYDKVGNLIESVETPNVVTNTGFTEVAALFGTNTAGSYTAFNYIGVGTGTTAATYTNTQLVAEITDSGLARAAVGTYNTLVTSAVANDTAQFQHQFSVTSAQAVTESAIFNASSVGTCLCRQTFSPINVASGDTLQITWKVTVSRP